MRRRRCGTADCSTGAGRRSCSLRAAPTPRWRSPAPRPCSAPARVQALHLNYGLRPDSGEDEESVPRPLQSLGVELRVEHPELAAGNVQAAARDARYEAAEHLRAETGAGGDRHRAHPHRSRRDRALPARDLARAPRPARAGAAQRAGGAAPARALRREVRELADASGLAFRDDPTNDDPLFARNRIRTRSCRCCDELAPAAERRSPRPGPSWPRRPRRSSSSPREALDAAGAGGDGARRAGRGLAELPPALRRLALRRLAERVAGRPFAARPRARGADLASRRAAPRAERSSSAAASGALRGGLVRFSPAPSRPRRGDPRVPGECRCGGWQVRAELTRAARPPPAPRSPPSTPPRSAPSSRCAPGARATGCGRSASVAQRAFRTCSPIAACRARCAARCRSSPPASRSPGSPGVAVADEFRSPSETERVACSRRARPDAAA